MRWCSGWGEKGIERLVGHGPRAKRSPTVPLSSVVAPCFRNNPSSQSSCVNRVEQRPVKVPTHKPRLKAAAHSFVGRPINPRPPTADLTSLLLFVTRAKCVRRGSRVGPTLVDSIQIEAFDSIPPHTNPSKIMSWQLRDPRPRGRGGGGGHRFRWQNDAAALMTTLPSTEFSKFEFEEAQPASRDVRSAARQPSATNKDPRAAFKARL